MVKRCDHCIFFIPSVFDQETESGYGCWYGHCLVKYDNKYIRNQKVKNMYFACELFIEIPSLNKHKWLWLCWWSFADLLEYLSFDLKQINIPLNFSERINLQ